MSVVIAVTVASSTALHAAKADKAERPDRRDKIERRLERANPTGRRQSREIAAPSGRTPTATHGGSRSPERDRDGAAAATASFDAFRVIVDRNIFDPTRIARAPRTTAPQPRVDTLALVGTLQSQNGVVAFFDGSFATKRVARPGDVVGDFTVQAIATDHVVLQKGAERISLPVADQLRRPEGGEWTVSAVDAASGASSAVAAPAAEQTDAPPPIPADASDVLRRLMEQRRKQLNQ